MNMIETKIIAYYLPQYHPFPENDKWWGKGFTEWTNVGKAKPLFSGHYQPKIPGELGYYDLRVPEVAEAQAQLAREAGVYGFCYWHYWFHGKELMEMPFYRMLETGKPDYPFCVGWANESWYSKLWNKDSVEAELLIEQRYSKDDHIEHFKKLLPAFKDERYITIENKPFFLIYRPLDMDDVQKFMQLWNNLLRKEGVAESFYFVAHARNEEECDKLRLMGFDAINIGPTTRCLNLYKGISWIRLKNKLKRFVTGCPNIIDYREIVNQLWKEEYEGKDDVLPSLIPNWDHSPRGGKNSLVFTNSSPSEWEKHVRNIVEKTARKQNQIIMLKSWNEWGEGNYLEPDYKYGKKYIDVLMKVLRDL